MTSYCLTSCPTARPRWSPRSSSTPPLRPVPSRCQISVLCSSVRIRGDPCGGPKSRFFSVCYGGAPTVGAYPVFVPEAGEFQLLSMTGPSCPCCRNSERFRHFIASGHPGSVRPPFGPILDALHSSFPTPQSTAVTGERAASPSRYVFRAETGARLVEAGRIEPPAAPVEFRPILHMRRIKDRFQEHHEAARPADILRRTATRTSTTPGYSVSGYAGPNRLL